MCWISLMLKCCTPRVLGRAREQASAQFEQVADLPAIRRDAFDLAGIEQKDSSGVLRAWGAYQGYESGDGGCYQS